MQRKVSLFNTMLPRLSSAFPSLHHSAHSPFAFTLPHFFPLFFFFLSYLIQDHHSLQFHIYSGHICIFCTVTALEVIMETNPSPFIFCHCSTIAFILIFLWVQLRPVQSSSTECSLPGSCSYMDLQRVYPPPISVLLSCLPGLDMHCLPSAKLVRISRGKKIRALRSFALQPAGTLDMGTAIFTYE